MCLYVIAYRSPCGFAPLDYPGHSSSAFVVRCVACQGGQDASPPTPKPERCSIDVGASRVCTEDFRNGPREASPSAPRPERYFIDGCASAACTVGLQFPPRDEARRCSLLRSPVYYMYVYIYLCHNVQYDVCKSQQLTYWKDKRHGVSRCGETRRSPLAGERSA